MIYYVYILDAKHSDEASVEVRVRYTRTCSLYNFSSSHGGVEVSRWLVDDGKWGNRMRNSLECDVSALHTTPLPLPFSLSLYLTLSLSFYSPLLSLSSYIHLSLSFSQTYILSSIGDTACSPLGVCFSPSNILI